MHSPHDSLRVYLSVLCVSAVVLLPFAATADEASLQVGVAKLDVTPDYPVRLSGYFARKSESDGSAQKLYTRALAIGSGPDDACVIVTLDNLAIPASLSERVAATLQQKANLPRERLALSATHTHCAPCLTDAAINIFGRPFTAEEKEHVDRYTAMVAEGMVSAALAALKDLRPARVEWGQGAATFAANRRTKGGPVDQAMPLLVARDAATGKPRALLVNYACHCTTLGPEINKTSGDWAGFAAEALERDNDGAVALVAIGCGADANPAPRGAIDIARQHGETIAAESNRLLAASGALKPLTAAPRAQLKRVALAYDKLPTRQEWEKLAQRTDPVGANARLQLARMERGEQVGADLPYIVESWVFGDQLAMVFLSGEVVVDYSLRLKQDFDPQRLWINAYSSDVACYIPSKRILAEGGYEAEGAMTYYARPGRLAPAVENDIIRTVHSVVPLSYRTAKSLEEFPPPKSAAEALDSFKLADADLKLELVAAEPLIASPVAIDWDTHGRLWVVEMYDYPSGLHEDWTPGGRIKVLESTHNDGRYDKATIVLDHLRFPQGLMSWRDGALVCAAPDLLFASFGRSPEGEAASRVLFSGFSPDNQQWALNGLAWGLDGWVYGASSIHNDPIRINGSQQAIDLGNRDFRCNPDTLAFEPAAGRTQYCRVRDDFGHWFGNDNSNPLWHYPMEERYVARNPHVTTPPPRVPIVKDGDPTRLYPASRVLERYNSPESANRVTSGCGPGIYRDKLLGEGFYGNAFFCEPVHNLVRRLTLEPSGATFSARRAPADRDAEFLTSTDNWFRPVQVRTGPDGALWVVDMYRFLIEHPRWISADRLSRIDSRAGADMGRIYRIVPTSASGRPAMEDLAKLSTDALAHRLDTINGTLRDLIHRELLHRQDKSAASALRDIARKSAWPATRLQALYALDGLASLSSADLLPALADTDPGVRAGAVRLAECRLADGPDLASAVLKLADDSTPAVCFQVALTLGEWNDQRIVPALAEIARSSLEDPWLRAAVANASLHYPTELLDAIAASDAPASPARADLLTQLAIISVATSDAGRASHAIQAVLPEDPNPTATTFATAASLLDASSRRYVDLTPTAQSRFVAITSTARATAADDKASIPLRSAALRLLGRDPLDPRDADLLKSLLQPQLPSTLHSAALDAAARSADPAIARMLASLWPTASPSVRSRVLQILLARPQSQLALLEAISSGGILATQIPIDARTRLLNSADEKVRQRAASVLAIAPPTTRADVLAKYQPALKLTGDPAHGRQLFEAACSACHAVKGIGHAVGPDLLALTDRSSQYLLTSILDPNAAVEGKYVAYRVQTTDGRDLSGLLADETATGFTILSGNAIREVVKRGEIKSLKSTGLSLMPEGLEQSMTPQDLADLIRFLQQN